MKIFISFQDSATNQTTDCFGTRPSRVAWDDVNRQPSRRSDGTYPSQFNAVSPCLLLLLRFFFFCSSPPPNKTLCGKLGCVPARALGGLAGLDWLPGVSAGERPPSLLQRQDELGKPPPPLHAPPRLPQLPCFATRKDNLRLEACAWGKTWQRGAKGRS